MKVLTHKINTVQDMIDCTNKENLDNFLDDLRMVMEHSHMIKSFSELMGVKAEVQSDGFEWIDDGKHDATFNIQTKIKGKQPKSGA